ncbi:hypothetical protein G3T14_08090 [Methylobacterium sp. BTF04]|uniref:hypothetical protein n=1 Tax=Methylobacterium sp. BTF04 TaxID=2708300 RepID=UPI0013D6F693|nr:hypothetical protein [Methylobacterium sp. BTF04]NEU12090.1 hypothetical protein [Methylobacterium sp. BTF04]
MRFTKLIFVGAVMFATPALAQAPNGDVGQPSRAVPQAGSTTGGPLDNPSSRDMAPASGDAMRPAGEAGMAPVAGAVDSAKSGNADQTNKPVSNTGSTSGGPAR